MDIAIMLSHSGQESVDTLKKIYEKSSEDARFYFRQSDNTFEVYRSVAYINIEEKKFEIVNYVRRYGISKTCRIYSREKKESKIIYNKGESYVISYYKGKKFIKLLEVNPTTEYFWDILIFLEPWTKFLKDNVMICNNLTFKMIHNRKLFSEKKLIKHLLGIPLKSYTRLRKYHAKSDKNEIHYRISEFSFFKKFLTDSRNNITNIDKIDKLIIDKKIDISTIIDTIKMGYTLNKPVNFNWSRRRFIETHDTWSIYITNKILEFENETFTPAKVYVDWGEFSGFPIFKTTRELGLEGLNQKHCVATYSGYIKSGMCGIYHIHGYTLELRYKKTRGLFINQFLGYKNQRAPTELVNVINKIILDFIKQYPEYGITKEVKVMVDESMVVKCDNIAYDDPFDNEFF